MEGSRLSYFNDIIPFILQTKSSKGKGGKSSMKVSSREESATETLGINKIFLSNFGIMKLTTFIYYIFLKRH